MSSNESTPWYETRLAKSITYLLGAIGVVAVVAPLFSSPRTSLIATYRQAPFIIPTKLQHDGMADSISGATRELITQLVTTLRTCSTDKERRILDSIYYKLPITAPASAQVAHFATRFNKLCVLHLINEGDKSLSSVQVLSGKYIYYEYLDNGGKLQHGESQGKFSIGELAPTEEKDVYLWNGGLLDLSNLTVVYPDGKVQAEKPTEITGATAWLINNSFLILSVFMSSLPLLLTYLMSRLRRR